MQQLTETALAADLEAKLAAHPGAVDVYHLLKSPGVLPTMLARYQRAEDGIPAAREKVFPKKSRIGGIYVYMMALLSAASSVFFLFHYIVPEPPRFTRSIATLGAPRESTVHLVLSDGTTVWLNAGSTLSYPRTFAGFKRREVTLTGEAYFDVAPIKGQPFIIRTAHQRIEVLGTQVDVSAYPDERFSAVSLLSGSVRVVPDGVNEMNKSLVLVPGEESWMDNRNPPTIHIIKMTDIRRTLSWRDASFDFDKTDLYTMMRQLGRWYDVDVVYDKGLPADTFTAHFSKNLPIDQVLRLLELTKEVRFTRQGRKVMVGRP